MFLLASHSVQLHGSVFILDARMNGHYQMILNVTFSACIQLHLFFLSLALSGGTRWYKNRIKWFFACLNKIITATLTPLTKPNEIGFPSHWQIERDREQTKNPVKSNTAAKCIKISNLNKSEYFMRDFDLHNWKTIVTIRFDSRCHDLKCTSINFTLCWLILVFDWFYNWNFCSCCRIRWNFHKLILQWNT